MWKVKQVVKEMLIGLTAWCLLVLVVLTIIATHKLAMALGVVAGYLSAILLLWHMCRHLDIALDMDAKHAQSHTQFAAVQRMAIMAVIMAVSMVGYRYIHPVGTVLGIFGVKIAAFLQPTVHKLFIKYGGKKK